MLEWVLNTPTPWTPIKVAGFKRGIDQPNIITKGDGYGGG